MSNKVKRIIDRSVSIILSSVIIFYLIRAMLDLWSFNEGILLNALVSMASVLFGIISVCLIIMIIAIVFFNNCGLFLRHVKPNYVILERGRPIQITETELYFWRFFNSELTFEKYDVINVENLVGEITFLTDNRQLVILECTIFIALNEFLCEKSIESLNERWRKLYKYSGDVDVPNEIKYFFNEFKYKKTKEIRSCYNPLCEEDQKMFSYLVCEYFEEKILEIPEIYKVTGGKFDLKNITIFNESNN